MKRGFVLCVLLILITLTGCGKQVIAPADQQTKTVENPLIGTWKFYADVPKIAYLQSWTLVFKEDGTFETLGDDMTKSDEVTKTGKNVSSTWGPKGTYSLSEDNKNLFMTREDENRSSAFLIDVKEEDGVTKLMFMEKNGEISEAASSDQVYYLIFNKQE